MESTSSDVRKDLHTPTYSWKLLRAGPLSLDGGGMFGVVPRVVWSKSAAPDELNRVTVGHNCLLLTPITPQPGIRHLLIEAGSGDKFDAKMRSVFGLSDRTVETAVVEAGVSCDSIDHAIVTHLHFDHAGGLTRRARPGETPDWTDPDSNLPVKLTFPNARIHAQDREWRDAMANNSVMTRTYLRDHLEPVRDRLTLAKSAAPFAATPARAQSPDVPLSGRMTEVLPGVFVFNVPGHTWGQQAVMFTDDHGRTVVFTPDVLPTVWHIGAAYSLSYDVEPFMSMISKRWFLEEALRGDWLLALDHEPGNPLQRVREDGKGWYKLVPEV